MGFPPAPSCALIPCCGVEAACMGNRKVKANYRRSNTAALVGATKYVGRVASSEQPVNIY
jgi:hypothetical protein